LTVVNNALRGLSKPSKCRCFAKNSETEIDRWFAAIDWAVDRRFEVPFLDTVANGYVLRYLHRTKIVH